MKYGQESDDYQEDNQESWRKKNFLINIGVISTDKLIKVLHLMWN